MAKELDPGEFVGGFLGQEEQANYSTDMHR